MTAYFKAIALLFALLCAQAAFAQERNQRQDHAVLRQAVEEFLRIQTSGLPGKASIAVGAIDSRLNLPACAAPQAFLPPSSRAWGKTTVGVRCTAPSPWIIYVSATVRVQGEYVVTAVPLAQGQSIGPKDVARIKGDLAALPPGIITDPSQAVGRVLSISLPVGAPLRQDALRNQLAIRQGQTVRLVSGGPAFQVSTEARALNNADEGQVTQVRTASGQTISGLAKAGGVVEVSH